MDNWDKKTEADWDGITERRHRPHEYDFRVIIREELTPIQRRQDEMRKAQIEIEKKIGDWESGARWFRVFIVGTVSLITAGAAVWEWMRTHVK